MTGIEVESTSEVNEIRQLRMGIGQVLNYAHILQRRGIAVHAALYVERQPTDAQRWNGITGNVGVTLVWPGTEDRLGLPPHWAEPTLDGSEPGDRPAGHRRTERETEEPSRRDLTGTCIRT
jgi:hypothetical protein